MAADRGPPGLSQAEAARRLAADGPNTLTQPERHTWRRIGRDAAREPMFLLLVGAAVLYLALGQRAEGIFLGCMVGVSLGLTFYQQGRTERALLALRDLSSPRATVCRDGTWQSIPGTGVVRGDIVALAEGDRVPADLRLLSGTGMQADESLLTGESMPVDKTSRARLFAGTLLVQGHGIARVTATGSGSQLGRIAASLHAVRAPLSPLQRQSAALARLFAGAGLALSGTLILSYGLLRGDWLQAILAGIALAMSMVPEELPVVLTIYPAMGAWRLARQQVLTRRLAAIETLGAVSVLCVDKTGTLTANRMEVAVLYSAGVRYDLPGALPGLPAGAIALVELALLASAPGSNDPIDQAVRRLAAASLPAQGFPGWEVAREFGISAAQRAVMQVWRRADRTLLAAAKGAPETISGWCVMHDDERTAIAAAATSLAHQGLRVIAVAHALLPGACVPAQPADMGLAFAGLLALADPLRPDIPACVAQCRAAGIRVVMITGDHPETALAIAAQAGLAPAPVLTGCALDTLDQAALDARIAGLSVCARITPVQKLRLVQAFVRHGATVAMTGDGVNDAPALKAAHVGIAMGGRGTDVAREAGALVLLDDRFASIVEAIRAGRRIHDNLRKAIRYVISMHAPIAGMAMLPVLAGWPPMLYPMHIVFMELIIDPACALVFENDPALPDLMCRPPRDPRQALFTRAALVRALAIGAMPLFVTACVYAWTLTLVSPQQARACGFTTLVLANLALILINRADGSQLKASLRQPNALLWIVVGAALGLLVLILYLPPLASVFQFAFLPPGLAAGAAAAGLASVLLPALLSQRHNP